MSTEKPTENSILNSFPADVENFSVEDASKNQVQKTIQISPNISAGATTGIFGCVDGFDGNRISGWYINIEKNAPALLNFRIKNINIGSVLTKNFRPDISAMMGNSVYCGFEFNRTHVYSDISSDFENIFVDESILAIQVYCSATSRPIFQHKQCEISKSDFRKFLDQGDANLVGVTQENIYSNESIVSKTASIKGRTAAPVASPIMMPAIKAYAEFTGMDSRRIFGTLSIDKENFESDYQRLDLWLLVDASVVESAKPTITFRKYEGNLAILDFSCLLPKEIFGESSHRIDVSFKGGRVVLNNKPFTFGPNNFDSNIEYIGGGRISGYFIERIPSPKAKLASIQIDNDDAFEIECDKPIHNNYSDGSVQKVGGFHFQLKEKYLDGLPHQIVLKFDGRIICTTYAMYIQRSNIDIIDADQISGWIYDPAISIKNPGLDLDVYIDEKLIDTITADISRNDVGRPCGFHLKLTQHTQNKPSFILTIRLSGSTLPVLNTPLIYSRRDSFIELIRSLSEKARNGELGLSENESAIFSRYLGEKIISDIRISPSSHVLFKKDRVDKNNSPVNVIVPVYDGINETAKCLAALFNSYNENETDFTVTLVDDCGPDARMGELLEKFAIHKKTRLISNERNLGFVSSVNKALVISKDRDVILLNADAVVSGNWLDRLRHAAYSSDSIASVTPFSNNATICSYPDPLLENPMPEDISLAEIDTICKMVNQGKTLEIPSGIGFCMYMRADAIAEVGLLDAERFGQGYGEENDWCIRARDLGWKHLHACDIFVEHIGGVSFGQAKKSSLVEKNLGILTAIYPEYTPIIMDYLQRDPARLARNRVTLERIKIRLAAADSIQLHISHSFGGGIEVFCNDEKTRLAAKNIATVTLESRGADNLIIKFEDLEAVYKRTIDMAALSSDLEKLSLSVIHINSDIGFDLDVWNLSQTLNVPFQVTIHDYTFVCPRVNFTVPNGNYCGEPSNSDSCNRCITKNKTYPYLEQRFIDLNSDVFEWRSFYNRQLELAQTVLVPDDDVQLRMKKYFPLITTTVRPHLMEPKNKIPSPILSEGEVLKIAVIGAIGPHKGINTLKSCVENANFLGLPLHFTVIGYTSSDQELLSFPNVTITGKYQPERLHEIIDQQAADIALFISPWPETYSYTLSEALNAMLWPVVLPIGAQASRLRKLSVGTILTEGSTGEQINSQLMDLAFPLKQKAAVNKNQRRNSSGGRSQ